MGRVSPYPIREGDWTSVRKAIQKMGSLGLGPTSSPTFAGLTLTGLTASKLVGTDVNKKLTTTTETFSPTFAGLTLTGLTGVLWANAGVVTGSATLDQLGSLAANKTFNNAAYSISFNFTNPTGQPTYDGAFEIQASGAFTGDLFHVHQHTGNPGATDLCHFDAADADVTVLRLQHAIAGGNCLEVGASGAIKLRITDDGGVFILEKAADLTDVAGYGQIWVKNDTPNSLYFTDDAGTATKLSHNLTTDIDHDALTNFVALEHVDHSAVNIVAGTGMSGGGSLSVSRTLDCTITQYTDEMAQDTIGSILTCSDASISITYDDATPFIRLNAVGGGYTDEQAQDAVGTIISTDGTLSVTYDDVNAIISIAANLTGINHDGLLNFVDLEHVSHSAVNIDTGTGLSGGGTISVTRTINVALSAFTAITATDVNNDYVPIWDATDSTAKKIAPTNLGHRFVDRGDPAIVDWNETGSKAVLNTDNTWRDLDCSAIVPAGAVAILFTVQVKDDTVDARFSLRKNGNTNTVNRTNYRTQVANVAIEGLTICPCDTNRVVEYNGDNLAFTSITVSVVGWWI